MLVNTEQTFLETGALHHTYIDWCQGQHWQIQML